MPCEMKNVFPQKKHSETEWKSTPLGKEKVAKRCQFNLMMSPIVVQEFSVLTFVLCSCTDAEFTKSPFLAKEAFSSKALILKNPQAATVSPEIYLGSCLDVAFSGTQKLASVIFLICKIPVNIHEEYFSLHQKALPGKKVPFSMKSVVCISRNNSVVKLLNSSDLFSKQPSLRLHTGCLFSWLSYFSIASYWKWVMTLLLIYILDIFSSFIDSKLELKVCNVYDKAVAFSKKFQLWICQVKENNFYTFRPPDLLWIKMNTQQSDVKDYRGEHLIGLSCQFNQYTSEMNKGNDKAICRHLQFQFPI